MLIGELTRELMGSKAEVRPVGRLEVKGKEKPVSAFVLVGVRG